MSGDTQRKLIAPHSSLITLTGIAHGGEAVGREGDLVAFVGLGLPGEQVKAEIYEQKPRFVRGRAVEVLNPAPERVTPPCPIFGTCGGCHWQHAAYAAQLQFKKQVLRDQLERIGRFGDPPIVEPIASPEEWHYRNTVQFVPGSYDASGAPVRSSAHAAAHGRLLCFQRALSHVPVPVEHCYISDDLINRTIHGAAWGAVSDRTWGALESIQVRVVPGEAVQITFGGSRAIGHEAFDKFVAGSKRALPELVGVCVAEGRGGRPQTVWGDGFLRFGVAGNVLSVPADGFVQVNVGIAECLVERVLDWLEPNETESIVDAYAGVGTFSLPLARRAGSVAAIESHRAAAGAAAVNAADAGLTNVAVTTTSVEEGLSRLSGGVDLLVLDPPRRGCSDGVLAEIVRLRPRAIAYVSCEPSTLARDLRRLVDGGYSLVKTGVADMFPQTYHLESVTLLRAG